MTRSERLPFIAAICGVFLLSTYCFPTTSAQSHSPQEKLSSTKIKDVVANWRRAMHAGSTVPAGDAVLLITESTEDGIPGNVREVLVPDGRYRRNVVREVDSEEVVVGSTSAGRRDWNGFVRHLEGYELARLRSRVSELQTLMFGPDVASIAEDKDAVVEGGLFVVTAQVPDGLPVTWYIDPKTWLPAKSSRPGEDSTISTDYPHSGGTTGWKSFGSGVLSPTWGRVSETDKPDYRWEIKTISTYVTRLQDFAPPAPGPSDVQMESSSPAVIPFSFESSHIVVPVRVNGRPPIGFILDTGDDQEVLNSARLKDFGLTAYGRTITSGGGNSAEYTYIKDVTFSLPGVEVAKQHVAAIDETGLEQALGIPIGGLLGYDFISRFVVELDYARKVMVLHRPNDWTYRGTGISIPLIFDQGIPFMRGNISVPTKPNIPAFFVLDIGAAETMTLTSPFVRANDLAKLAQTSATINRPTGLEQQFFAQNNVRGRIEELNLNGLVVKDIPINMSVNTKGAYASESFSGTVGESIFRRYHVFLDYLRHQVILEPTAESDRSFPERKTYGLSVLAGGSDLHTYTVVGVRPGSAADRDGFTKGDRIVKLDDKPSSDFLLSDLRDKLSVAGDRHRVDILRENAILRLNIEVELTNIDAR